MSTLGSLEQTFRYTQNPRSLFEISVLGLTNSDSFREIEQLKNRVAELEKRLASSRSDKAMNIMRDPEILVDPKLNYFDEKEIWAKLLISLRNNNEFQIYVICEKLKHSMKDNVLTLLAYEDEYKILIQHKEIIEKLLIQIDKKIKLDISLLEKKKEFDLVEFLKQEFGNKLEVIEGDN